MTDRYTIEYEVGDLLFEFTPAAGFKGDLAVTSGDATITLKTDLASAKGRTALIKEGRDLYPEAFTLDELDFRRALNDLATHVDDEIKIRTAKAEEDDEEDEISDLAPEVGTDEYEAAMDILKSGNVLGRAAMAMRRLGHVGEWNNKKLAFLCSLSARRPTPRVRRAKITCGIRCCRSFPRSSYTSVRGSRRRRFSGPT